MIYALVLGNFAVGIVFGYCLRLLQTTAQAKRQMTRCTWCGAKRSRPRAPVCDACLGIAKPLVKVQQSKDGTPWPAEVDGD